MFNTSKIQFESNSQPSKGASVGAPGCVQYIKDTIRKQFTTAWAFWYAQAELCSIHQRYNSKAIHNKSKGSDVAGVAVFNTSKIQFESNSQRRHNQLYTSFCCVQYIKDTIRKQFTTGYLTKTNQWLLCSIHQRYNSKAIHNHFSLVARLIAAVFNTSKIQFESNSQLVCLSAN